MSVYKKPFNTLTEDEQKQLEIARTILVAGDSLHGPNLDHVNWVLANLVHLLDLASVEHGHAVAYVELSRDTEGYGIAILNTSKQSAT